MPKYEINVPGKGTFEVDSPEELSDAQVYAAIESQLSQPEPKESALRKAADLPVNFTKGVVSGARMLTDVFGADNPISKNLRGVEDYLGGLLSAQAKNDQQEIAKIMKEAEDKGVLEQVQAGLKAFTVAPADIMSQAFGTVIPALAGGLAGAGLKIGARAAAIGTGAAMGAGVGKSAIYDAVTEELSKANLPKEVIERAATQAQEYGGKNLDLILANTLLGGVASATGIEKTIIPGMVKNIGANVAKRGAMGRAIATGAPEFITEGLQGGTEQAAQNVALQREGYDVPTFRGVAGASTMEGVAGGTLGAGVGAFSRPQAAPAPAAEPPVVEAPIAPPVQEPVQVAEEPPARYQPLSADEARQQDYERQVARQNAFQERNFPTAEPTAETAQQAYERQMAEQAQRSAVRQAGVTEQQTLLNEEQLAARRMQAQALAEQQFGLGVGEARAPITEQDRINRQLAAQQEMDADRFKQQTVPPEVTPAQAQVRTPAPIPTAETARGFDQQAALLAQREGLSPAEQVALSDQADALGGTGQRQVPQTRFVDLTPLTPVQARQKLAVFQDENPDGDFFITPHPQVGGRFAIEQRADKQIAQRNQEALDFVQRQEQIEAGEKAQAQAKADVAAKQQAEQAAAQRQADIQAAFASAPPNPQAVIQAFSVPPFARNAEQVAVIRQATERMNPSDLSVLEMAGQNPGSMKNAVERIEREHRIKYSLANKPSAEAKATAAEMRKKLLPILKRFGLGNVGLALVDSIENGTVEGTYSKQIITLALDSDNPLGVMRHEVIHALRELGAFTDAEWRVLSKAAKDKWIDQFFSPEKQEAYKALYLNNKGNLDGFQEVMQEEAIAEAFRFYSEPNNKPPSGLIANLMRRLNAFFDAIREFFGAKGVKDVDELFLPNRIFADIERGAIQPGRVGVRKEEMPKYSLRTGLPKAIARAADEVGLTDQELAATSLPLQTGKRGDETFKTPTIGGLKETIGFLEDRRLESGVPVLDMMKDEDHDQIAKLITAEAMAAIRAGGDAMDWYDGVITRTLNMASLKHPELRTDQNAATAFRVAMAITSQGLNVEDNIKLADRIYTTYRKNNKFPEVGSGESEAVMKNSFRRANDMIAEMGFDGFRQFLQTPFTVRELQQATGQKISGEMLDEIVLGSSVFGPKIGFGFYSNLNGNFEPVTMDMWFMRTIGRLTGKLRAFDETKVGKQVDRLVASLDETGTDGLYAKDFDQDLINQAKVDRNAALDLAKIVNRAHEKDFKVNRAQFDAKTRKKTNLVNAAGAILKSLEKPIDAPTSGGQRRKLRAIFDKVRNNVRTLYGKDVPPASLQAVIWYPEQSLYKSLGVKLRVTNQDYAGAMRKVLLEEGFDAKNISAAAELGSGRVQPRAEESVAAEQQAGGKKPSRAGKVEGAAAKPSTDAQVKYSLRTPKTPEFKRFFGNSKVVNPDGTPKVMYHGTARDITEFVPKQAGAIFLTESPTFAETFTKDSLQYMINEQKQLLSSEFESMSPDKQLAILKKAIRLGVKQKSISKESAAKTIAGFEQDAADGKSFTSKQFNDVAEFFEDEIKNNLQTGPNIMPVYVRAENPFDFENENHLARLEMYFGDNPEIMEEIADGVWDTIESPEVQDAIQGLGHDGFYVLESGRKNLAVYNPNQIKSAIGNVGTYGKTADIRYSLKNAPPNQYTKLAAEDPTTGEAMINAANSVFNAVRNDQSRTSGRVALVDRYAGVSKTLQPIPLFNDGVLRADMLHHAKAQGINLIKAGLVTGTPVLNDDGTIGIEASENNLARAAQLADNLNSNKNVIESGLSGRGYLATIARALRGADIIEEDKATRALGEQQISDANFLAGELKKELKEGKITPRQVAQFQNAIDELRRLGNENRKVNRELQVKPEDIAWAKKQLEITPEVQDILDIWKAVNTSLVNLYEAVGIIDKQTADKYRAQKNYVPLFKSREDLNEEGFFRTGTGAKTTAKIKELKGADITRNIWENIDKQFATMIAAAYENQTRRVSVQQMRSIDPELAEITNASDPRTNLRYRENGKDVHVIIENPNDLAAFQSMTYQMGPIMQIFGGFTKVLRAGALLNPMFWLRQLIRDPISATLTGQAGIVTPFHSAKEFISVITRNSEEARILASRGVIGQFDSTVSLQEFLGNVGKEKGKEPGFIQRGLHKLLEIHEASDAATRVAIYKKAKAKALADGMSERQAVDYAVMKARESINFAITGNSQFLAAARNMIPFLNATIVGLDTLYRAATGYGLNPEEKAKAQRMFAARASMMVAMSLAYALMMQDDDDYKKLPDYMKDGNWLFPTSDKDGKTFVRLPVPYEVGYLFKTIPEVFVRYMSGTSTGKEALASLKAGFIQNLPTGGVPIPQFAKPTLEVITNHSFHTGRDIEGVADSRLPVSERGRKASEFAKMMSKAGLDNIGMSPAKIDVFLKGTFAEMGTFGLELADALILAGTGQEKTPKNFENLPFMRSFLTDPQVNKAISDFYEIEKSAEQVANMFTQYKKEGRGEDLQALVSDKEKLAQIQAAPVLRKIAQQMTKINNAIKVIDNNKDIPPQERRDRINELQRTLATVAQQGYQVAGIAGLSR